MPEKESKDGIGDPKTKRTKRYVFDNIIENDVSPNEPVRERVKYGDNRELFLALHHILLMN